MRHPYIRRTRRPYIRRPRRPAAGSPVSAFRLTRLSLPFALVFLVLGLLATVQWRAQAAVSPAAAPSSQSRDLSALTIQRLEAEQKELKEQLATLEKKAAQYQQVATPGKESLQEIQQDLARQKMLAGITPVNGPGVKVRLDDSPRTPPPTGDVNDYIIHDYQLRDVVTALWRAGAEAIALNGERIVGTSSIYCVGSTILVNSTRLSPAYEVLAIGDPAKLEKALAEDPALNGVKNQAKTYGVSIGWEKAGSISVPALSGGYATKYLGARQQ